jgi:DNA-binding transcriptional MerR regulator
VRSHASTNRPLYSAELARLAGVSTDTLRYYERRGLLPTAPRSPSGYRLFPPKALARVQLIRSALSIGFWVNDLAGIFRELAVEKLLALEARLHELRSWRRTLRDTLAGWDSVLAKTPRHKQARLLKAFAATHPKCRTRSSPLALLPRGNPKRGKQS